MVPAASDPQYLVEGCAATVPPLLAGWPSGVASLRKCSPPPKRRYAVVGPGAAIARSEALGWLVAISPEGKRAPQRPVADHVEGEARHDQNAAEKLNRA